MQRLLLLSGPIAVGKSAVANVLIGEHDFTSIRSGPYLRELATIQCRGHSRLELQGLGDHLDATTDYRWLVDDVAAAAFASNPDHRFWLLDCVRKARQIEHFRQRYGKAVIHIHLHAPENILEARYTERIAAGNEYTGNTPYAVAITHPNEIAARDLRRIADRTIDLSRVSPEEAALEIFRFSNEA